MPSATVTRLRPYALTVAVAGSHFAVQAGVSHHHRDHVPDHDRRHLGPPDPGG